MTPAAPTPEQVLLIFAANIEAHREAEAARNALVDISWPRHSSDEPDQELEQAQRRRTDALKHCVEVSQQALALDPATLRQQATALAEAQEREALAGLASSMAADIAYFELQEQRCLAEGDTEAGARYQARLRVLRPYLIRIEGLIEFVALKGATHAE